MTELGGGEEQNEKKEKIPAEEMKRRMEAVWERPENWADGMDISSRIVELPLGTQVIEQERGRRVLKAVMPNGPHIDGDKSKPMHVPIAVFEKDAKIKAIVRSARTFFHYALRGEVTFTGKVPPIHG